jgi:hypothetical protein
MSGMGGWATPGIGADRTVAESEILWGADQARNAALWLNAVISGATRDAGNTPTTVLRPGLLLGKVTASGELEEWDADAADGTENIWGILDSELRAQDFDATNQDRVFRVLAARAPVKPRKLLIQGAAFVGHADEYLARRMLAHAGFVLDDDPGNYLSGLNQRVSRVTGIADTLTAAETGTLLLYSNVAAVAVTLPAIQPGLTYDIIREGDEEIVISSSEGDNIIIGNDLSADSITFTTATEQIGARVRVSAIYVNGTLKWLMEVVHTPIGTGVAFHTYALAT